MKRTNTGTYLDFVDKELREHFAFAGQQKLFSVLGDNTGITQVLTGEDMNRVTKVSQKYGKRFASEIKQMIATVASGVMRWKQTGDITHLDKTVWPYFVPSQILGNGTKTVKLSSSWCEQFENTTLDLPANLYRQPYNAICVSLPKDYAETKTVGNTQFADGELMDGALPECMALVWSPESRFLFFEECLTFGERTPFLTGAALP